MNDFIKIDLHIHTPASKCYKGEDNEEEYFNIINQAKNKKLKIIAITDHNTIEGYKKICQFKENLIKERETLEGITDSQQSKQKLEDVSKKLKTFDDILILPGIEFEVLDGVHFLVIFKEKTDPNIIEDFLIKSGYSKKDFGVENSNNENILSLKDFFEMTKKYDCFVIDAHTDAEKGLYNTVVAHPLRKFCFTSEQLVAIGYKNEVKKEEVKNLLISKEYNRQNQLAFVKFSDAHEISKIGSNFTWVRLSYLNFQSIKEAFLNPQENVSTEEPKSSKILDNLIKNENYISIENLETEINKFIFKKAICALNNTDGGYCLIGLDKKNVKKGIILGINDQEINKNVTNIINQFSELLKEITGSLKYKYGPRAYPLQGGKAIISFHISKGTKIVGIKNEGINYLYDKHDINITDPNTIQDLIEERQLPIIENKILPKIQTIETECDLIKNYFKSILIINKIEKISTPLINIINRPQVITETKINQTDSLKLDHLIDNSPNGDPVGNVIYEQDFESERFEDAFMRFSSPKINFKKIKQTPEKNENVIVLPKNIVFYEEKKYSFFKNNIIGAIFFNSNNNNYSNKFITAYLKSSFFIWYRLNKFEKVDIRSIKTLSEIYIPKIHLKNKIDGQIIKDIEKLVDEAINQENKFLSDINYIKPVKDLNKILSIKTKQLEVEKLENKILKKCNNHNKIISIIFRQIDQKIYNLLKLEEQEISVIEEYLTEKKIFH